MTKFYFQNLVQNVTSKDFTLETISIDGYYKARDHKQLIDEGLDTYWHESLKGIPQDIYDVVEKATLQHYNLKKRLYERCTFEELRKVNKKEIVMIVLDSDIDGRGPIQVKKQRWLKFVHTIAKRFEIIRKRVNELNFFTTEDSLTKRQYYQKNKTNNFAAAKKFSKNGVNIFQKFKDDLFNAKLLLKNIHHYFRGKSHKITNLQPIYNDFKSKYSTNISLAKFRKALYTLDISFRLPRNYYNDTKITIEQRFNFAIRFLEGMVNHERRILFFDITSVSSRHKRTKEWVSRLRPTGKEYCRSNDIIHVLMIVSTQAVIAMQMVDTLNSVVIFDFLRQAFNKLHTRTQEEKYQLVLDNDGKHKTLIMKALCKEKQVHFTFIVPRNPFFNVIEYVFRFCKTKMYCHFENKR